MSRDRTDRVVSRFVLVTLVLPGIVAAVGLVVQLLALPHVPGRIPTHWDAAGHPDGWGPIWLPFVLTVVLGFGLPAVIGCAGLPSLRRGERSPAFRLFAAQALGISVMQTIIATTVMLQSTGASESRERTVWLALVAGLLIGVGAAVGAWFLQPTVTRGASPYAVEPLPLAPTERASLMRTASLPVPAVAIVTAVTVVVGLRAVFSWIIGDRSGLAWIPTVFAVLLVVLIATTVAFHVRVDAQGLSVRSVLGVPRFRVPLDEVGSVAVVDARSLSLAGSWGIRVWPGRRTIVMRATTGIRVTRRDGSLFFVTVADAATGAALLETLAARAEGVAGRARQGSEERGESRDG